MVPFGRCFLFGRRAGTRAPQSGAESGCWPFPAFMVLSLNTYMSDKTMPRVSEESAPPRGWRGGALSSRRLPGPLAWCAGQARRTTHTPRTVPRSARTAQRPRMRALCAAIPARSPLLPALTRSLRAASVFPTSPPQQARGRGREHYGSATRVNRQEGGPIRKRTEGGTDCDNDRGRCKVQRWCWTYG
jgi:hypothetical protein